MIPRLLAGACLGAALLASCDTSSSGNRVPRALTPVVFDSARDVSVLFGGDPSSPFAGTWERSTGAWVRRATLDEGPSAREGHALAFDSVRGVTVLFGGFVGDNVLNNETWEWDGTTWTLRDTPFGPSPRAGHAMGFDSLRGVTVLFGGSPETGSDNQTWEWNGTVWQQRFVIGPGRRTRHAIAFDEARGVMLLFGGYDGLYDGEFWEWDGGFQWIRREPDPIPSRRLDHAMAFDAARGVMVLVGGFDGERNGETWEWDGSSWRLESAVGPGPRSAHSMAYDSDRGRIVLFGGFDRGPMTDTWEWDGMDWVEAPLDALAPESNGFGGFRATSYSVREDPDGRGAYLVEEGAVELLPDGSSRARVLRR